jgi:amidase
VSVDRLGLAALGAVELASMLAAKQVSAVEVLTDHLRVLEEANPRVNAVCTVSAERAVAAAEDADAAIAAGRVLGPLHGLPVVHKDVFETAGVRTTYGSLTHRDHVPTVDATVVERCREAGAVMIGKTNTPQFATGGHTSNRVFGTTRNPLDPSRTAGGSSGGSAAALAAHMAPLATGTDMAGSLRVPSAFCGVVGMRPTPGRVPLWPGEGLDFGLTVAGPMARSVEDVALLYSVLARQDVTVPSSTTSPLRVAWSQLAGVSINAELAQVLAKVPETLSATCLVEEAEPDLRDARACLDPFRGRQYAQNYGHWLEKAPALLDPLVRANIELGLTYSDEDVARAERLRKVLVRRVTQFFARFDVLVVPGSVVWPFPAEQWTPDGGEGRQGTGYLDWLEPYVRFSVLGVPVVLLPVGRTASGVPVSVQLVGPPGRDAELLAIAQYLDSVLQAANRNVA